jgi:transcriptional regulator with XRE-family HTH domain
MTGKALRKDQLVEGRRLADALRAARERRAEPQTELAAATGISVDAIRKLEQARVPSPSFFTVARMARELNVRLDALADDALGQRQRRKAKR